MELPITVTLGLGGTIVLDLPVSLSCTVAQLVQQVQVIRKEEDIQADVVFENVVLQSISLLGDVGLFSGAVVNIIRREWQRGMRVRCEKPLANGGETRFQMGTIAAIVNNVPKIQADGEPLAAFTPDDFLSMEFAGETVQIHQEVVTKATINVEDDLVVVDESAPCKTKEVSVGECVRCRSPDVPAASTADWKTGLVVRVNPVAITNVEDYDDQFDATGYTYDEIVDDKDRERVVRVFIWDILSATAQSAALEGH